MKSNTPFGVRYRYALSIALRNLRGRAVQSILSVIVVGMAVALSVAILVMADALAQGIIRASDAFGVLVIGPKGSAQQLALNAILLQDVPIGTMDQGVYLALQARYPNLQIAPIAMGDNVAGMPIIGTNTTFFELRRTASEPPAFALVAGRLFETDFEAVLGAEAARQLGLGVGDSFFASHGATRGLPSDVHDRYSYKVVGVLGRAYSPYDRAVLTNVGSVWRVHESPSGVDPGYTVRPRTDTQTALRGRVTAALVLPYGVALNDIYRISQQVNSTDDAQAVFPGQQIGGLFSLFDQGQAILNIVGAVALLMACLTILLSLYSTTLARQQFIAVMRGLGASRGVVFAMTLAEAAWLSAFGVVVGAILGHVVAAVVSGVLAAQSAIPITTRFLPDQEIPLLVIPLVLGIVSGLIPAAMAYRVNVIDKLFAG
jgi:putative ABC transport system permease protein